jgi:hypothetical protein
MKVVHRDWVRRLAGLGLTSALSVMLSAAGSAQTVTGRAYGAYVAAPTGSLSQSPLAVLPPVSGTDGDVASAAADAEAVGGVLSSSFLNSVTSGALGTAQAGAQSVATLGSTSILNGLIRASSVTAIATSSRTASGATSSAAGSTLENLVVNGVPVTSGDGTVAPNTRLSLPNVGYVVLNEQIPTGDGVTTSGLTVNMIHVYLQNVLGDALGGGVLTTVGEIVVGSATSSVGS